MVVDGNNVAPVTEELLPVIGEQRGQKMNIDRFDFTSLKFIF